MPKRLLFLAVALLSCIALSSCETLKGAGAGFCQDVKNTKNNIVNAGKAIKHADQKMQEDLW